MKVTINLWNKYVQEFLQKVLLSFTLTHSAVCCFCIEFYMYSITIVNNRHGRDYSTLNIYMVILSFFYDLLP